MYRKFNPELNAHILTIYAGEYYISNTAEIISTVLGSCISVCLYDLKMQIGGMNHFMLPGETSVRPDLSNPERRLRSEELNENAMRYGITAMEVLIAELIKKGAGRDSLEAKIFGGGNVISRQAGRPSVGERNIGFAKAFLKTEGIPIAGEDVGGSFGRKIFFFSGRKSIFLKQVSIESALNEERKYMDKIKDYKAKSDITLF